jgi:hypothetical protein
MPTARSILAAARKVWSFCDGNTQLFPSLGRISPKAGEIAAAPAFTAKLPLM